MTPTRYPLDFTPWQPGRIIGFAGSWYPMSGAEVNACREGDAAILKAAIDSAMEHRIRDNRNWAPPPKDGHNG